MIVDFVDVFFHFARQRWSNFAVGGFALYMRSISVELCFKINKYRTTRGEFLIGDGLLKHGIALVYLGVECGCVKFFPGHRKFVDKRKMKTAQAFYRGIASAFRKSRGAATRN